jgi:hypothetical protein
MIACAMPASYSDLRDRLAAYSPFAGISHRVPSGNEYALISGLHGAYYRIRRASRDEGAVEGTPDPALAPS